MKAQFDTVAEDYDAQLQKGLSLTGESKEYFAEERLKWLRGRLHELGVEPETVLDFGCGTGSATPFLFRHLRVRNLVGSDVSEESLRVARETYGGEYSTEFVTCGNEPEGEADLAFCNGVFHHILPEEREMAVAQVKAALKPGGYFAFWENNPWNPLMRHAMSKVPFDVDAIMVWPGEARRLLREGGFDPVLTDFRFYFPNFLRALRPLETWLLKIPFGAQYLVLSRSS